MSRNYQVFFIFFLSLFLYFFAINYFTPYMGDDLGRAYHMPDNFEKPWRTLCRAASFTMHEYMTWTGRAVVTFITHLAFISPLVLNVLNTLMFCLLLHAIFLNAALRQLKTYFDLSMLLLLVSLFWWMMPEFGHVMFWKTVSIGYLWPMTGALYFIYPLLKLLKNEDIILRSSYKKWLMVIGGLFLGNCLENLSVTLCLLIFFILLWLRIKNRKLPNWFIMSGISFAIGTFFLIVAPGNYVRAGEQIAKQTDAIIYSNFIEKIYFFTLTIFQYLSPLLLILILVATFTWRSCKNKELLFVFIALSIISAYAMIGAPGINFHTRKTFCSDIFMIIAIVFLLMQSTLSKNIHILIKPISLILLCILTLSMTSTYYNAKSLDQQIQLRKNLLEIYKKNYADTIILPSLYSLETNTNTYKKKHTIFTPHMAIVDVQINDRLNHVRTFLRYNKFHHSLMKRSTLLMEPYVIFLSDLIEENPATKPNNFVFSYKLKDGVLFYSNMENSCDAIPSKNDFFLDVYPKTLKIFPDANKKFESTLIPWNSENNKVTVITDKGNIKKNVCVMAVRLPNYPIARIRFGQLIYQKNTVHPLWQMELTNINQTPYIFYSFVRKLESFFDHIHQWRKGHHVA